MSVHLASLDTGPPNLDHMWGLAHKAVVEIDADIGRIVALWRELAAAFRLTVMGVSFGW
jgi:hypothetical protein